jgi:tetratricopeptide (TPR) repeat protein
MARRMASAFALSMLMVACAIAQIPNPGNGPAEGIPPATPAHQPDRPPLPPDVKSPDAPTSDPSGNPVTRTLKRLSPNCINAVFHACWSSPPEKAQPPLTEERKGAASREVGELYYDRGNYRAAESRFHEALEFNPRDARAAFELAQSLEKLSRIPEAIEQYRVCLDITSGGTYGERCRKAIDRLTMQAHASSTR